MDRSARTAATSLRPVQSRALLALALLVPAQSVGLVAMLHAFPGSLGKAIAVGTRVWLLLFPIAWAVWIERSRPRPVRIPRRGLAVGAISGIAMALVMLGGFALIRPHIDLAALRARAAMTGFDRPALFVVACAYIVIFNPLLEEYLWRWFVLEKVEQALSGGRSTAPAAAIASALFTAHHAIALAAWVDWRWNLLGCAAVFVGGLLWGLMRQRYRSIWPGYLSHAFADVAIVVMAYDLVFRP